MAQALYMFGGHCNFDTPEMFIMDGGEAYLPELPDMLEIPSAPERPRSNAVAAAIGRSIYIIGGSYVEKEWLRNVVRLNLDTLLYDEVSFLPFALSGNLCVLPAACLIFVSGLGNVDRGHCDAILHYLLAVWIFGFLIIKQVRVVSSSGNQ